MGKEGNRMKTFLANVWKYIAIFLSGVVAALVYAMRNFNDQTVINTDGYIRQQSNIQETKIGKVKNRGEGIQDVDQSPDMTSREPIRRQLRKERRRERKSRSQTEVP